MDLPRKNCWSIAEWAGETSPDGVQHLLGRAKWVAPMAATTLTSSITVAVHIMLLWATLIHRATGLILLLPPAIGSLIAVFFVHKSARMHHAVHASQRCPLMDPAKGTIQPQQMPPTASAVLRPGAHRGARSGTALIADCAAA